MRWRGRSLLVARDVCGAVRKATVDAPPLVAASGLDDRNTSISDTMAARLVLDSISSAQRETRAMNEMARVVGRSLSLGDTLTGVLEVVSSLLPLESAVDALYDGPGLSAESGIA